MRLVYRLSIAFILLAGCSPPSTRLSWKGISFEEAQDSLSSPSANLEEITSDTQSSPSKELEEQLPPLLEFSRFAGEFLYMMEESSNADYQQVSEMLELELSATPSNSDQNVSAQFYLKLACPGDWNPAVTDFSAGLVRVDSAELDSLDFSQLIRDGDFLLRFRDCELGDSKLNAIMPGRFLKEEEQVAFRNTNLTVSQTSLAITVNAQGSTLTQAEASLGILAFGCEGGNDCLDEVWVKAEVETSAGTYIASFLYKFGSSLDATIEMRLDAVDGYSYCLYRYDESTSLLDCEEAIGLE
ncbi:MAG: hypothetical protein MK135_01965 [Polyangiaceae bacterium]|nr:hypothetical protein [Polyangiaceae bacterium]